MLTKSHIKYITVNTENIFPRSWVVCYKIRSYLLVRIFCSYLRKAAHFLVENLALYLKCNTELQFKVRLSRWITEEETTILALKACNDFHSNTWKHFPNINYHSTSLPPTLPGEDQPCIPSASTSPAWVCKECGTKPKVLLFNYYHNS